MAGSWSSVTKNKGYLESAWKPCIGFEYEFTADSSDGSVPDLPTASCSGALGAVSVVYDGTTAPNSTTITVKDVNGCTIASGTLTASGYLDLDRPMLFVPGPLTVSISGNTTSSAKAKVILVIF